jgi:putative effector of murein hydrolase
VICKIAIRHIRSALARRFPVVTALEFAGVPDSLARGLAYGTLAAGIGTAHTSMEGQTQRVAAGVAMEAATIAIPLRPLC